MQRLDTEVFRHINGWPEALSPVFTFFSEGNKNPLVIALLAVLVAYLCWNKNTRMATLLALLAVALANETCDMLKAWLQDPRPCNELANVHLRVKRLTSYGTASSHAANLAAVAAVFMSFRVRWGWVWAIAAVMNGLSRVYVGVHYPGQVLLGWIVGILAGLVVASVWEWVESLRAVTGAGQAEGRPVPSDPGSPEEPQRP